MPRWITILACFIGLACGFAPAHADQGQMFADLGDFPLENGLQIRNCRIGYRTFGELNVEADNAVLFPTWFAGTSRELADFIGPGRLIDSARHFIVAVDALGNGVSSSPSTWAPQSAAEFPDITVRDMVNAQHALLTRFLGLKHLHAVVGISMGGMQAFQWLVAYPDYMDKAAIIAGTPRLTAYDTLLWRTELQALEDLAACTAPRTDPMSELLNIHALALWTPQYIVTQTRPTDLAHFLETQLAPLRQVHPLDWAAQLKAMLAHDITRSYGGSLEQAAAAVKAQVLLVLSRQDHMVNPAPARAMCRLLKATTLELDSDCGHVILLCEMDTIRRVLTRFLAE